MAGSFVSGGGTLSAGPYVTKQSIGQSLTGNNSSGGVANSVGFWHLYDLINGSSTTGTFTVTTIADAGTGSLRWAIDSANLTAGLNLINFDIPDTVVHTITLLGSLPGITESVFIDGFSQPGARQNSSDIGDNAKLLIELDGSQLASNSVGIHLIGGPSTVRGLVVNRFGTGILVDSGTASSGNVITGNFIGTNPSGTTAVPNGLGMLVRGHGTLIGGTSASGRNIVSGNGSYGLNISAADNSVVQGNFIGTDAGGAGPVGNHDGGLYLSASHVTIGGTVPGSGNIVAYNGTSPATEAGIAVTGPGSGNAILGNSIFLNAGLGIDLGPSPDGVTPNDSCDTDAGGANNLQNHPILTFALSGGGRTIINGTLNSKANNLYRLEFFSSPTRDTSGYGEGKTFLGFINVTTDNSCVTSFSETAPFEVSPGAYISATATDTGNNTSEFSNAVAASVTGVRDARAQIPVAYRLEQNYPNPFNPSTRIDYELPQESRVRIGIYSPLGQLIVLLKDGIEYEGFKSVTWDASNAASGIYFYRLEAVSTSDAGRIFTEVKKLLLLK